MRNKINSKQNTTPRDRIGARLRIKIMRPTHLGSTDKSPEFESSLTCRAPLSRARPLSKVVYLPRTFHHHHHHHHHHISVMELGHLLTRSGLTYPEVYSKVCHDSFCQLVNSVSLPRVIYYEAFYLHVVSSFSYIPVICLNLMLFLIPLKFVCLFCNCPIVSCCPSHVFHLCCCYSSGVYCFNP
jgi:hypothetical protein